MTDADRCWSRGGGHKNLSAFPRGRKTDDVAKANSEILLMPSVSVMTLRRRRKKRRGGGREGGKLKGCPRRTNKRRRFDFGVVSTNHVEPSRLAKSKAFGA